MIILLATEGKYAIGNDFPMFTIPLKMEGATSQSLEDFQWWAYSSDFKKWLDKNPREWVADSEETAKYGEISDIIRESKGGSGISLQKALREIEESVNEGRVSKFGDFASSELFESEKDQNAQERSTKLFFAYNKLMNDGKLEKNYVVKSQQPGKSKAVFLCLEDQETNTNLEQTLDAYKTTALEIDNKGAKFRLFQISETKLSGPVSDDATAPSLAQDALSQGIKLGTYAVAGTAIFAGIKYLGSAFALRRGWKAIKFLRTGKEAGKDSAKSASLLKKASGGIKSLWNAVSPMKAVSFWSKAGKAGVEGAKVQRALGNMEKAGIVAKGLGMVKGFITGAKAATGAVKAAELTNPIGWALLAIDAVGSTWNWYSGNQAPRYGTVDSFAKESFDPKSIKVGVPITICWSQPAGGWGMAVSFLFNNETRTTMELVKVADTGARSIFILNQINSKEVQKQIAKYDMTLISFDNSDVVDRGWIDNEDLDFEILSINKDLNSIFNYQGSCDWDVFENEFDNASGTLLIADPNAPDEYEFHFSDSEENVINVVGKKITTEELSKFSSEDLNRVFGVTLSKESESRIKTGEQKSPEEEEIKDSLNYKFSSKLMESEIITKFSDFKNFSNSPIDEDDSSVIYEEASPEESQMIQLTPEQKSGPAEMAVYVVTERDYADPKLRGKYETGEFNNFLLDAADWEAKNGASVEIDPNTDEILEDSRRGLYKYVEKPEEIKPVIKDEVQDASDDEEKPGDDKKDKEVEVKQDDYYIKVNPEDVSIKNKKNSTVVRDASLTGGVNLFDTILTERDKEALKIENWKTITFAKELFDSRGDVTEVRLKNKYAPFGDKSRSYRATDGEAFELAKRFVEQTKDRIKYE